MKDLVTKIKQFLISKKSKLGKKFELALAFLLGLVVIVIFIGSFNNQTKEESKEEIKEEETIDAYIESTEQRLQNILSSIKGAGRVKVFISANESTKFIYVSDSDIKTSGEGSSISSSSNSIVFTKNGTYLEPILELQIYPQIQGVLIVAEGATNEKTKLSLINATSIALNLEISKIEVLAAEKE